MKLGFIIDSSSGLSKKEANKLKWGFLPLYISVNEKEFADGVDISIKEYYNMIKITDNTKTSASSIGASIEIFEKFSKEFDHVIVYPLSSNLSSQKNNLSVVAKDFNNIHIVDSKSIGQWIVEDINNTIEFAKTNNNIEDIFNYIQNLSNKTYGHVVPHTLDWLVKGGRLSKSAANMARLAKIIPIIKLNDGKLEKHSKGRTFDKTVNKTLKNFIEKYKNEQYIIYHGGSKDIDVYISNLKKYTNAKITIKLLPPVIFNHTGPGVIAIVSKK